MQLYDWFWPISAALVSTIYFFLIKYYVKEKNPAIIVLVILLELLVIYLYFKSLENVKSGVMYAIINGLSVILGALIAIVFFGETLGMMDYVGILAIVIGIMTVGKK
jgi:multidrug transporter EmrE-like cation transporter